MKPAVLEPVDKKLLNLLQWAFPLVARPYQALAEKLGVTEEEVLERIRALKGEVIRQTSAIFDTRKLGYATSLVAVRVPAERADEAAVVLNRHPGVSHNYLRNHDYNIWYTVAVPPNSRLGLERTVDILARECGAEQSRLLPTLRMYKVSVKLDVAGEGSNGNSQEEMPEWPPRPRSFTGKEIGLIRELQQDLPVEPEPFSGMAERLGIGQDEVLEGARRFLADGSMRRFASVLHHRQAGFVANCMGVWNVPLERMDECGRIIMGLPQVSHCYQRPVYNDWPYSLYSMIHARTRQEVDTIMEDLAQKTGVADRTALWSLKEYKKVRVPYFTPELDQWESSRL